MTTGMTTLAGLTLSSPVLVASGCGGTGRELEPWISFEALGGFVTRSVTLDPRPGAQAPRVVETPSGLLHTEGPSPGLEPFLATELPWLARSGTRVIVSIAGRSLGEYAELARRIGRAPGLAAIEVAVAGEPFQAASVVYASVFGAVLASMRSLRPSMVVFDTEIVDLTDKLDAPVEATIHLRGGRPEGPVQEVVLTHTDIHAHNSFDAPETVAPAPARTLQLAGDRLSYTFAPQSVTRLLVPLG